MLRNNILKITDISESRLTEQNNTTNMKNARSFTLEKFGLLNERSVPSHVFNILFM